MDLKMMINPRSHIDNVRRVMSCKICRRLLYKELASELGRIRSKKKAKSSRENGKLGGRPKGGT